MVTWTTDQPIRVGDKVTNLMLGQLASDINALHDGGAGGAGALAVPTAADVGMPAGLFISGQFPASVAYSFSNGYKRKAPYFVNVSIGIKRTTAFYVGVWIIRQTTFVKDTLNSGSYSYDNVATQLNKGMHINNYEATAVPDAWFEAPSTDNYNWQTVLKFYPDELDRPISYEDGDTVFYEETRFHIAVAPMDGTSANLPSVLASMTLLGGR